MTEAFELNNKIVLIDYFQGKVNREEKPDEAGMVDVHWKTKKVRIFFNPAQGKDYPDSDWMDFTPLEICRINDAIKRIDSKPIFRDIDDFDLPF